MTQEIAVEKPVNYYSHPRDELIALIPHDVERVLEIGCGEGALARRLKEVHSDHTPEIVGVELCQASAVLAARFMDRVLVGDIEALQLEYEHYFDCVIFGDVLEHLENPWGILRKTRTWLRNRGRVVASIPNIQHWRAVVNLLMGRWDYCQDGTMDITHLRFFTKRAIRRLFSDTGYRIQVLKPGLLRKRARFANLLTGGMFEPFLAFQYLVVAENQPLDSLDCSASL